MRCRRTAGPTLCTHPHTYSCFLLVAFIISRWRLTKPLGCSLIFLHMTFIALTLLTNSIGGKQPVLLLPNTPGWSD